MRRRLLYLNRHRGGVGALRGPRDRRRDRRTARRRDYNVGIVYSRTGLLAAYGAEYIEGLRYGIQYATRGTGKVNGKKINLSLADDATDPATGVSEMKDFIGQGYKIIAGADVVGRRAPGGAARRAEPRALHLRPGRHGRDHRASTSTRSAPAGRPTRTSPTPRPTSTGAGKNVLVFAQDSAFGQGNFAGGQGGHRRQGHNVSPLYVPLSATDFTPVRPAGEAGEARTCSTSRGPGTTAAQMWPALDQQGVFSCVEDDRDRPRRAGDLPELRPGDLEDPVPLALPLPGAGQQGEQLAAGADAEEEPVPGPVHAGRVRGGADDRARAAEGRLRRGQDDRARSRGGSSSPRRAGRRSGRRITRCCSRCSGSRSARSSKVWTAKVLGTATLVPDGAAHHHRRSRARRRRFDDMGS